MIPSIFTQYGEQRRNESGGAAPSLRAAEQIGIDAVEAIHRAADAFSFIKPERALQDADVD